MVKRTETKKTAEKVAKKLPAKQLPAKKAKPTSYTNADEDEIADDAGTTAPVSKKAPKVTQASKAEKQSSIGRQRKEYCASLIAMVKYTDEQIAEMVADKFTDKEFPLRRVKVVRDEMNSGKRGEQKQVYKRMVNVGGKLAEFVPEPKAEKKPKVAKVEKVEKVAKKSKVVPAGVK